MYVLAINPGSTSTKIALFAKEDRVWQETVEHAAQDLKGFERIWDQLDFRRREVERCLEGHAVRLAELLAVVGRGGLLKPLQGGTYLVNQRMLADARAAKRGEHASNLGCALAAELARRAGVSAYVVDPISVDEFEPLARYSGHPLIERSSLSHALNIHAAAREAASALRVTLDKANFVVAHLGGGISVAPVKSGRIIDVNDAASDGPFSPERTGGLPLQPFIRLCFSGNYTEEEVKRLVMGEGGLKAYLGTSSAREVEKRIAQADEKATEVYRAMAYQIAKEIGAMATVLRGEVNAVVITGGLAKSDILLAWIKESVGFIAPILVFPGELEMEAMNAGVLRVLSGAEAPKLYA
ncbi:MAG: butyrate kinase [Calditrichaeota bacterium]|nr:MAG: butyrate kinase [Calditrichota bacterium]